MLINNVGAYKFKVSMKQKHKTLSNW